MSERSTEFSWPKSQVSAQISDVGLQTVDALDDCWNKIGVVGDQTCRELTRHIHCHNCPVYSAAAAQFLDRPLAPDYRREWTEHFALDKQIATPAKTSAVIFRVGGEWLGMPTPAFQEVSERRAMHTVPHRRRGVVLGIVNVRGEILICASIGKLLGLESRYNSPSPPFTPLTPDAVEVRGQRSEVRGQKSDLRPLASDLSRPGGEGQVLMVKRQIAVFDRLLVADWNGQRVAFPVDEVHGVHRFHSADLREAPATVAHSTMSCATGVFPWHNFTVGFLDPAALFASLNRNLS